jgi:DNA-binding NarL/FixJ family response regulator
VKQIRIILAEMPQMLLDIVSEIVASEPDLTIVGVLTGKANLEEAVRLSHADIVVLQQTSNPAQAGDTAPRLASRPFKVLAISDDGRQGLLYELRAQCTAIGEMSAVDLVAAIRAAAGRGLS